MKSSFFSGGRGPGCWFRGMARAVAPLQALLRSTAWLGEVAAARPRLRDEPLLGRTLAEVALRELPARGSQPQVGRSGRRPSVSAAERISSRSTKSPPPTSRRRASPKKDENAAVVGAQHTAARGSADPLLLEPRAGRDLLVRRANGIPDVPHTAVAGAQGGASPPTTVQTRPYPKMPGNPSDPETTSRDWLRGLGRRAVRALRHGFPEAAEKLGRSLIQREAAVVVLQHAPPEEADRPAIPPEPWEMDLQGERAPADLLRRWMAPRRSSETTRREGPASLHPGRVEPPPGRPAPPLPEAASGQRPATTESASTPAAPPRPGPPGDVPAPTSDAPALAVTGLLDAALPPLLPPRDSGPSSPWKAPAQAPAAVGRLEAELPEEDLGRLAANIKRILDEEARRHGIDV